MTPDSPIKLVSELLDLPLYDTEGKYCGIVDDVEFTGDAGKPLKVKALLVGPGAYQGRLPRWAMSIVRKVAGERMTRVPMDKVRSIKAAVYLDVPGGELGLHRDDVTAGKWMPRWGAL
jgi:sporulation protein YlmC with PRC-barrel domain